MTLEPINPDDLPTPQAYTHVIVATGSRLVFVAGQVALFGDHKPADSLVGVEALSDPGYLIEVEAIAVTDG